MIEEEFLDVAHEVRLIDVYRVFHPLADLGWVDFDLGIFTVCPILIRQMKFRPELA